MLHTYASLGSTDPDEVGRFAASLEKEWGNGSGALDADKIASDLATLMSDTEAIRIWVNKMIAHLDRDPPDRAPNLGELDKAIDDATAGFRKYGRLLTSADYAVDAPMLDLSWWVPLRSLFATNGPE